MGNEIHAYNIMLPCYIFIWSCVTDQMQILPKHMKTSDLTENLAMQAEFPSYITVITVFIKQNTNNTGHMAFERYFGV